MQNVLENTADAGEMSQQHPGLVSRIFRDYRNNFGLFWQVMVPLIIVNLLFYLGMFLFAESMFSDGQWTISTERGIAAYTSFSQSGLTIGVLSGVYTLICAAFAPVWATLTTHLYTERVGGHVQKAD